MTQTERKLAFLDWEMGAFFHFGIRTFYEGHKDWDMKPMPAEAFNPQKLDCEQWIRAVKAGGATYAILVCKHHDGFANWPSKYTDYSVKNTPWKNGRGDVVREFTDACRKWDMKIGLYYSPAQFGSEQADRKDYDDYFINQISELLTGYGKIDYLWFDGCGSENHQYDTVRIVREIRRMQPEILLFNMWDPDTRWIGNEVGLAGMDCAPETDRLAVSVQTDKTEAADGRCLMPAECDCRIRQSWFYGDADKDTLKSVDELFGMYLCSVGHGANLLLNIAPNREGLLPQEDVARLLELHQRIEEAFRTPLISFDRFEREGNTFTARIHSEAVNPTLLRYVVIEEDISAGSAVTDFEIDILPHEYGEPLMMYRGARIGHKAICPLPALWARGVVVKINAATGPCTLKNITVY